MVCGLVLESQSLTDSDGFGRSHFDTSIGFLAQIGFLPISPGSVVPTLTQ